MLISLKLNGFNSVSKTTFDVSILIGDCLVPPHAGCNLGHSCGAAI